MTLTVGGLTSIYNTSGANSNYDTPTNPKITSTSTSATNKVFSIIYTDDSVNTTISEPISSAGLLTAYSNLDNTNGHTIRCYDQTTGLNLQTVDLTTDTYFVLVHSDDSNMHHFAKIETIETGDELGDSFTFEPKLGNRIAKGTKFMVFKGPTITNSEKIIAITCGLDNSGFLVDTNSDGSANQSDYVVSRPLWYFYNDKLVKSNELDHNTKYFVRIQEASSGSSVTLNASSEKVAFVTLIETFYRIMDSSKYSYVVKLKDNLKIKDDPNTATSNESSVLTGTFIDYTDYNDCFINARRDSDDVYSSLSLTGPTRYIHYRDSPEKNNLLNNVIESYVEESIGSRAGMSTSKVIDNNQILGKKLKTNQDYVIRQAIGRGNFNDWVEVGEIDSFVSVSGANYFYSLKNSKFGEQINISRYFNQNDEVKIGDRICIVSGRHLSDQLSFNDFSRLETEGQFTNTFTMSSLTSGTKIYRRAFNKNESNLLTSITFEERNIERLRVVFYSDSAKAIEATVTAFPTASPTVDETYGLLFLNFPENHHDSDDNGLEYIEGDYVILYEIFTGKIEKINKKIENGNNIVTISGRNTLSKLVNPIINRDTLYSLDTVYSSRNPYKAVSSLYGTTLTTSGFNSKDITFSVASSATLVKEGTEIFSDEGFIGTLSADITLSTSGTTATTLVDFPKIHSVGKSAFAHLITFSEDMILNKAMASNLAISSSTDLSGATNKGYSFRDGTTITTVGAEGVTLAGTSSDSNPLAIGFDITTTDSVGEKDSIFFAKSNFSSDETVNTMLDFTILSIREEASNKTVKLAPYIPLTLGRGQSNFRDTSGTTLIKVAQTNGAGNTNDGIIEIDTITNHIIPRHTPIYIGGIFAGRMISQTSRGSPFTVSSNITISLQSPKLDFAYLDNADVQIPSSKIHHELHLINGEHLHGGKTIGLLGPNLNIIDFQPFDSSVSNHFSYSHKFGNSIFRIFNLEKGKIGISKNMNDLTLLNVINKEEPLFNYYATSYKGRNKVKYNRVGLTTSEKILPIERRGLRPITFSNYEEPILPNISGGLAMTSNVMHQYMRFRDVHGIGSSGNQLEDSLYNVSPNAARLFLFINTDIYPYSSTRTDSLMNAATRNISKYGLLTIGELKKTDSGELKESVSGNTKRTTLLDSSYSHSSIIESNKTLSSLKRFGLMRLTEFITDLSFNPINPETKIDTEMTAKDVSIVYNYTIKRITDSGGAACNIASTSNYSHVSSHSFNVVFDRVPNNLVVGDALVDPISNKIWAEVGSSWSGGSATVPLSIIGGKTEDGDFYTGTVLVIPKSHIDESVELTGRINDNTIYNNSTYYSNLFHPRKALLFGTGGSSGFSDISASPNSEFADEYSDDILLPFAQETYGMTHPFAFRMPNSRKSFLNEKISQAVSITNDSTTLTVADSGVLQVGAQIGFHAPFVTTNYYAIKSITNSTTVELAGAVSQDSGGNLPTNADFYVKPAKRDGHLSAIIKQIDHAPISSQPEIDASVTYSYFAFSDLSRYKTVVLGSYSVQSGIASSEGESIKLKGLGLGRVSDSGTSNLIVPAYSGIRYAFYDNDGSNKYVRTNVSGAYAAYKFFIDTNDSEFGSPVTRYGVGNKTYKAYKISHKGKYNFLQYVDLTGCYLVPLSGKTTTEKTISRTNNYSADVHVDDKIAYIVSHTYDTVTTVTDDEDFSWLITDVDINNTNEEYVIMQPNPVCMWRQSPNKIHINHISRQYTLNPKFDKMYDDIKDFFYTGGSNNDRTFSKNMSKEGIRSMYVLVDADNISGSGKTVLRSRAEVNDIFDNSDAEMCFSDGENNLVSSAKLMHYGGGDAFSLLELEKTKYLEGVVSASETFEIKVNGDIKDTDKRALIGSTLDISREAEELVEDLFIENNINYSLTAPKYKLYASPDFQGTSLYVLARYLLNLKDKEIFDSAGTIKARSIDNSSIVSKYAFDDDNIIEYELIDSELDFYNEVIVYGAAHKAIKKNINSIKNIGRKTLEEFDKKLKTQNDVDKRGFELLKIHNNETSNLEIKTHIKFVQTVSSGDVVSVEIKQENIPYNLYTIVEVNYTISGLATLVLGKYSTNLSDRLAEIMLTNKQTNSYIRKKDFAENELSFDFFENIKIKELNVTLRKRTQTGITLGFSHTLNTNTSTIGFGGGTITHAVLLEEDI